MAKPIDLPSYLTEDGKVIVASNSFIYSISTYNYFPKESRFELHSVKYFYSPKRLKFKKDRTIDTTKTLVTIKEIDWEAAPLEYIRSNNLKLIKNDKRKI